jgi:hypothetical protein
MYSLLGQQINLEQADYIASHNMSFLFQTSGTSHRSGHRGLQQIDRITSRSCSDHMKEYFPDKGTKAHLHLRDLTIQAHHCLQKDRNALPSQLSLSNGTSPLIDSLDWSHFGYHVPEGRARELVSLVPGGTDVVEVDTLVIRPKQRKGFAQQDISRTPWLRAVGGVTQNLDPRRDLSGSSGQTDPDNSHYIAFQGERKEFPDYSGRHIYILHDMSSKDYNRIMTDEIEQKFQGTKQNPTRPAVGDFQPVSEFHNMVLPHVLACSSYFRDSTSKPNSAVSVPSIDDDEAAPGTASSAILLRGTSNVANLGLAQGPLIEGIEDYSPE